MGYKQEVETGEAQILAELEGEVKAYQVNITDIYRDQADTNKAFAIQVTDPELLAATGGIVQGMSGSPIAQKRKTDRRCDTCFCTGFYQRLRHFI